MMAFLAADTRIIATSNKTRPKLEYKYVGLDPLHSTFFRLFIKDIFSLDECTFPEIDSPRFSFHDHVVERVEVMGIVVRVDLKETKHSYSIDDGTGVILCNLWRKQRQQTAEVIGGLPKSLCRKHQEEIRSSYVPLNEGFHLGDSVRCRGRVTVFAGQKEIDLLDMAKVDNPNRELERILELPVLYSDCYSKPFNLPKSIMTNSTDFNHSLRPEMVKRAILNCIGESKATVQTFSDEEMKSWLFYYLQTSSNDFVNDPPLFLIRATLASISETEGLICKRKDLKNTYEVIKDGCGLNAEVLKLMQMLCEGIQSDGTGCRINQIQNLLKASHRYGDVTPKALQKSVESLENCSQVISVDVNKYIPLF